MMAENVVKTGWNVGRPSWLSRLFTSNPGCLWFTSPFLTDCLWLQRRATAASSFETEVFRLFRGHFARFVNVYTVIFVQLSRRAAASTC